MPEANRPKLVLLDGNSLLYRGFFAMRALTTSTGIPTNAIFSFTSMLLTLREQQKPDVMICAWDTPQPTFRHEEFTDYKGQREAPPDELRMQGPIAREVLNAFSVPMLEAPGYEADDIIGTLAGRGCAQGYDVMIVTGDLDALQLVKPGVRVMTTVKGVSDVVIYDEEAVKARYGLTPDQLADYRALKGDTSDNIPGVPGVGEKTASQLLQQYGTVENLIEHLDEIKQPKLQTSLKASVDQMRLSRRLAIILRDVPITIDLPALDADPHTPDWNAVRALFERLEFRQMLRRIPKSEDARQQSAALAGSRGSETDIDAPGYDPFAETVDEVPTPPAEPPKPLQVREAWDTESRQAMTDAVRAAKRAGLRLHLTDGVMDSHICGVSFAVGDSVVYYAPCMSAPAVAADAPAGDLGGLFEESAAMPEPVPEIPPEVKALLEDDSVSKVTYDSKGDTAVLQRHGVCLRGVTFDTEIAAYLLNAGRRSGYPLLEIAADYGGRTLTPLDKKERKTAEGDAIVAHDREEAIKEAEAILVVSDVLEPKLQGENLDSVLHTLELPITPILAEMELAGLMLDVGAMQRISGEMQTKVAELEKQIFAIAGTEFTISSPKQLAEVLFEKLKLPSGKKTKTGYSTSADVLEELAADYPIVNLILSHRELMKLKGTYVDAMPALVRPDTGRLHTSLSQTVAATGRLSSSNPNLQNIPIRTAIGREIRRAFVAPPGKVLLSADYSQIELRVFAHMSKDSELIAAFASGEDIHNYTAGRMYGVAIHDVTTDMRRAAKTVNYAVIYGISDFVLGRRLGITVAEAKDLKTSYFARFPGIKTFIDETIAFAREKGYVQTIFGRRRWMPDINSRVFHFRLAAERAAANMPIQGSAADVMKLAMIRAWHMLRDEKFEAKLLLQVHDELLFEAPPEEVPTLAARVHDCMANAYPMEVALEVEVKTGATWADVTPVAEADAEDVGGVE